MSEIKQKVIIIGAGVSGLTAGIYCLDNGFDVEIYEKQSEKQQKFNKILL